MKVAEHVLKKVLFCLEGFGKQPSSKNGSVRISNFPANFTHRHDARSTTVQ